MSATVLCENCGLRVPVPDGHDRARLRCPECGVLCDVPVALRQSAATCPECGERLPAGKPPCPRCSAQRIKPAGASPWRVSGAPLPALPAAPRPLPAAPEPLLEGTDEDDGKPYHVPGDSEEPCPKCRKALPRGTVLCVHCGFNRETGATRQRTYEKIDRQWEPNLTFSARFAIFLAFQGLALTAALIVISADGMSLGLVLALLLGAALTAFILGSYVRLNLVRSQKGRVRLTTTWRLGFIALPAVDSRWREYEGVITSHAHVSGFSDWLTLLLLLPWGILPAILWWFYIIRADHFDVSLVKDHGSCQLILFRSRSDAMAQDIADTIRSVTGLA